MVLLLAALYLREVVAEEEAAEGVLDAAAHLDQVGEDVLGGRLLGRNVDGAHRQEQVCGQRRERARETEREVRVVERGGRWLLGCCGGCVQAVRRAQSRGSTLPACWTSS